MPNKNSTKQLTPPKLNVGKLVTDLGGAYNMARLMVDSMSYVLTPDAIYKWIQRNRVAPEWVVLVRDMASVHNIVVDLEDMLSKPEKTAKLNSAQRTAKMKRLKLSRGRFQL